MTDTGTPETGSTVGVIPFLAAAYALIPILGAGLWLLFGTIDAPRPPLDLLSLWEITVVLLAIICGMRAPWLTSLVTRPQCIALAILGVAIVFSTLVTASAAEWVAQRALDRLLHIIAAVCLCFLLTRASRPALLTMTLALPAVTLLHLPFVAWAYAMHFDTDWMPWGYGPLGFVHVTNWGVMLAMGLCATIGLLAGSTRPGLAIRLGALVVIACLGAALFWSGSRTGWTGVCVAFVVGTIVAPSAHLRALPIAAAGLAGGAAVSLLLESPKPAYGLLNSLRLSANATDGNTLSSGRLEMWGDALALIPNHPIFGHGIDQFTLHTSYHVSHVEPHNSVLQLFFELGLLGGGAALFLLASLYVRAALRRRADGGPALSGAFMALTGLATMSLLTGVIYYSASAMAVGVCLAILFARPQTRHSGL